MTTTTTALVIKALNVKPTAINDRAMNFLTHIINVFGADLEPKHLAGIVKQNVQFRIKSGVKNPDVPMLQDAIELGKVLINANR
jgi:hypothetical protein